LTFLKCACEAVLRVLREHSDYLLSVWRSFFQDTIFASSSDSIISPQQSTIILTQIAGKLNSTLLSSSTTSSFSGVTGSSSSIYAAQDNAVEGAVEYLIGEARSEERLSRMYVGWQAWL
jgi:phosphatidylinositol kinase/protein kinase (PI-3  family)